jgi:hypothetical protein
MAGQACQDSLGKLKVQQRVRANQASQVNQARVRKKAKASQASQASQVKAKKRAMAGQGFQDILGQAYLVIQDQAYLDTQGLVYLVTQGQACLAIQDQAHLGSVASLDLVALVVSQVLVACQATVGDQPFHCPHHQLQVRLLALRLHAYKEKCLNQKCYRKGRSIPWQP